MKECKIFDKGLCLGCTGLGEKHWIGPEGCEIYKKMSNMTGLQLCKKIIEGIQQEIGV